MDKLFFSENLINLSLKITIVENMRENCLKLVNRIKNCQQFLGLFMLKYLVKF